MRIRGGMTGAAALAIVLVLPAAPSAAADLGTLEGTWSARVGWGGDTLRLRIQWRSESGMSLIREEIVLPVAEVQGADPADFSRSWAPLEWKWVRSAGTFSFTGEGAWFFRPGGPFVFTPTPEFAARLGALGSVGVDARALLWLGLKDVHLDLVIALAEMGYQGLDVDDLVMLTRTGIEPAWIRSMQGLGYQPSVQDLLRLHSRGIDAGTVEGYASAGLTGIPVESLLRLHSNGVEAGWLAGMRDAGCGLDEVDELLRLHVHGVSPVSVASYRSLRGFDADTESILRLHAQGIDPDYAGEVLAAAPASAGIDDVIRLHQSGIEPAFVREVAAMGYDDVDGIVRLRHHGVAPATIRELRELGLRSLDVEDLVRLTTHGVDPAFVRRLQRGGHKDLTVDRLIRARTQGEASLGESSGD